MQPPLRDAMVKIMFRSNDFNIFVLASPVVGAKSASIRHLQLEIYMMFE